MTPTLLVCGLFALLVFSVGWATTNSTPVVQTSSGLVGAAYTAAPIALMVSGTGANNSGGVGRELATGFGPNAIRVDGFPTDLSQDGYALNGCFVLDLAASASATIDFTNVVGAATSAAGDNLTALLNKLIVNNYGSADVSIAPGASNGLTFLTGTTPALDCPAASKQRLESVAGYTVSSSHKTMLVTNLSSTVAATVGFGYGGS
jgi:hypothetical protein